MECTKCHKIFTRGDNLRRHMKIHDRPYIQGGSRIYQPETKNVDGDIVNAIRKLIEKLDHIVKKGGSLTDIVLKELKEDHGIDLLKVNEEEEEEEEKEKKTYVDEVGEEIFHDVISKDKKKLEKMLDSLSQEYDFSELAIEIKELLNTYFTTKTETSTRYYMKYDHKNELIHHRLIADITKKLHTLQGRGRKLLALEMEILVRRIEKTRTAVHELLRGMDIENDDDKHRYLRSLESRGLIDSAEINELRQLNPDNVRQVLKTKDR